MANLEELYYQYVESDTPNPKYVSNAVQAFMYHIGKPDCDAYAMAMADAYSKAAFIEGFKTAMSLSVSGNSN